MHELPITESILDICLRHAQQAGASRITDIHLVIGQLSSFVDESIQIYWDIISAGTPAIGARLHFQRIPAEVRCTKCGAVYHLDTRDFICPDCGSVRAEIITGDQLYVQSIEIVEGKSDEQQAQYSGHRKYSERK